MDKDDASKELKIQKMLNPLTMTKSEISNRNQYTVRPTDVYLAPSQNKSSTDQNLESPIRQDLILPTKQTKASPKIHQVKKQNKSKKFYTLDEETIEDDIVQVNIKPLHHVPAIQW